MVKSSLGIMEFQSKEDLINHIRGRVRQMMGKTSESAYQGDPNSPMNVMLANFPELRQALESLMGFQFRIFVNDIQWVAPKPTTFRVILANGQMFTLIWNTEDFLAKVSGVKYDLICGRFDFNVGVNKPFCTLNGSGCR